MTSSEDKKNNARCALTEELCTKRAVEGISLAAPGTESLKPQKIHSLLRIVNATSIFSLSQ